MHNCQTFEQAVKKMDLDSSYGMSSSSPLLRLPGIFRKGKYFASAFGRHKFTLRLKRVRGHFGPPFDRFHDASIFREGTRD